MITGLLIYLGIGLLIGYSATGIGYKNGGAPYHKPWEMIDCWPTAGVVAAITVGWLPILIFIFVQHLRYRP